MVLYGMEQQLKHSNKTKNNKVMKKLVIIIAIFSLAITACQKEFEPIAQDDRQQTQKMLADAVISSGFNWKTTKDVSISIKVSADDVLKIVSSKGDSYHKAFLQSGKTYKSKITIPANEEEVTLAYAGTNLKIPIVDNEISYNFK